MFRKQNESGSAQNYTMFYCVKISTKLTESQWAKQNELFVSDFVALEYSFLFLLHINSGFQYDLFQEGDDFVFQLKHRGVPPLVFKADNETSGTR